MTSSISSAMDKIRETGKALGGDAGDVTALKGQMTEKTAKIVAEKINKAAVNPETGAVITAAESADVKKICDNFDKISQGVESTKVATPTACL